MILKKHHRFLIDTIPSEPTFTITSKRVVHQLLQVLKVRTGEEFIVFSNESPDYVVAMTDRAKDAVTVRVVVELSAKQGLKDIIIALSIVKGAAFETAVQKLTELGVSEIVPLHSTRTVKQSVRLDRLKAISDEALEQSGGNKRVTIHEPMSIKDCLAKFPYDSAVLHPLSEHGADTSEVKVLYVGPEGGWSSEDIKVFEEHAVPYVSLGPRILRTETAAIVGAYELLRK